MGWFRYQSLLLLSASLVIGIWGATAEGRAFGLEGFFSNLQGTVGGLMQDVNDAVEETIQQTSVLSSFFGRGVTRKDVTLPEIVGSVFSRNNPMPVSDSVSGGTSVTFGDGSSFVAAASSGGAISVTSENGTVTVSTMPPSQSKHTGPRHPQTPDQHEHGGIFNDAADARETAELDAPSPEQYEDGSGSESTSNMTADEAFIELMSDWKSYVLSGIWDEQDALNSGRVSSDARQASTLGPVSSRIVNGIFLENRLVTGAPFSVKFFFDKERKFYCSGSLITYTHVLTAAHCGVVVGDTVRIGGQTLRSGLNGTVSSVYMHPLFSAHSLAYDVAVVELEAVPQATFENGVIPARVNRRNLVPSSDFVGVVSAHGATQADGSEISQVILSTRQRVLELGECQKEIQQGKVGNDGSFVCVGDGVRSTTCVGDSGAGLWHVRTKTDRLGRKGWFYEIVAIVSFGEVTDDALCPSGKPAVFQRTATSYEWIKSIIEAPLQSN